jgi:acetyl esterase
MTIDPSFAPYLEQAMAGRTEPLDRANIAQRRAKMQAARTTGEPAWPDIHVEWLTIENDGVPLRLRLFRPKHDFASPGILYCHGGGWIYGSPDQSAELACRYVREVGAAVISPEYRLSPEHPFPAAFEDCYAALTFMAAGANVAGIDPTRLAVAGESSGANLAAACALAARDRAGPTIRLQLLNYPALGTNFETASYLDNADAPILSRHEMVYFWHNYLSGDLGCRNPYAVPLLADNLAGLPPAHIIVAEYDPLRDDGIAYAGRLRKAGSPVTLRHAQRLTHGLFRGLSASDDVQDLAHAVCDALKSAFSNQKTQQGGRDGSHPEHYSSDR